jgi:hypothetical protein
MPGEPVGTTGASDATIADVVERPERFIGRTVTLRGEVERAYSPRAFTLGGDDLLFDRELLVLGRSGAAGHEAGSGDPVVETDAVQVTGTLRQMALTDLEREVGWDLDPELEVTLAGAPTVLIADRVQLTPRQAQRDATPQDR